MEVYKLRDFAKWAKRVGLIDETLLDSVDEISQGLVGASLGSDLYKKRLGVAGRGKRGGIRVIILLKRPRMMVFLFGYQKNEKDALHKRELKALRIYANDFSKLNEHELYERERSGALIRVVEK